MMPELYWIEGPWRGHLAITARPRGGDWLADEAAAWRRAGVNVIVSLLEEDEAAQLDLDAEGVEARTQGLRFVSFPIPDRGLPASTEAAQNLIADLIESLDAGNNVAVHCRQGLGRSALITAGVLTSSGYPPERAIELVSSARRQPVPETDDQRQWIRSLPHRPTALAT
jgi:protein-tyrosine phosphatase